MSKSKVKSKSKIKIKPVVKKSSEKKSIPAAENNILDSETQTEIQNNISAPEIPVLNSETKTGLFTDPNPTDILSNFKISKANKTKFYKIADKMHISQEELLKLAIKAVNNKKVEFTTKSVYVIK
jgi:hypothetical protein